MRLTPITSNTEGFWTLKKNSGTYKNKDITIVDTCI